VNKRLKEAIVLLVILAGALGLMFCLSGCGDPMMEGIAIGVGTSKAASDASEMARESKTALVAKILQLQQDLEAAATPEAYAAIEAELAAANKKQEYVELTSAIADTVKSGLERDWGDKPFEGDSGTNNLAWILGSLATVATGYAGKKTLDVKRKDDAIARVKIAAKPADEKEIYEALNDGA
jgi:hypothetical protein